MRALVLINGGAGSVADENQQAREIAKAFAAAGAQVEVDVVDPQDLDHAIKTSWAGAERPDVVVVAGGDGTVNGAAAVAADTDVVLSVLPLGTFNHFAKDLGIPNDLEDAARAIVDGSERRVDVGEVNGHVFVNNAALGVYPTMVARRDRIRDQRGWGKVRAVPVAVASVLSDLPTHHLDLTGDESWNKAGVRTPLLFVGNGVYDNASGGTLEREGLQSGELGVVLARTTSRVGLVAAALRALVRGTRDASQIETVSLTELTVRSRSSRLRVARDGEIGWIDTPLKFRCRPNALRVRAPRPD